MWLILQVIILSIVILAIFEELIEFFVNRYALGPAAWEGKLKNFYQKIRNWLKKKLKKEPSVG
jgi:hypothetical protein